MSANIFAAKHAHSFFGRLKVIRFFGRLDHRIADAILPLSTPKLFLLSILMWNECASTLMISISGLRPVLAETSRALNVSMGYKPLSV